MRSLDLDAFGGLLDLLMERGYVVVGPTVRDGAIVFDQIGGIEDLPRGVREVQAPGRYRIEQMTDSRLFAWAHGADSAKRFLFPPHELIQRSGQQGGRIQVEPVSLPDVRYALVGLRPCDLHAIEIQDRVFMIADPAYRARREGALLIAVNCEVPAETCFCASMGSGPRCGAGFDLALTELDDATFTVDIGSAAGAELLDAVRATKADGARVAASYAVSERAERAMGRTLDTSDLPDLLYRNREHARWDEVAGRCLTCTNCTMVCPTCFCHDLTDEISLDGAQATRARDWASCFSEGFSHMSFGSVRSSPRSRYRQWLTHKFASWIDQFDTSGCVGCGRCITWCPVGIDVTEEIAAIRTGGGSSSAAEEVGA
jgi:sulfhydrogenase subunit beta (sulfur reductase)